jgi:hypothetical protein
MAGIASIGAALGVAMDKYQGRCSSSTSVFATGWTDGKLPQVDNMTPGELSNCILEAARAIDTHAGAYLEALLCSYDGVAGYQEALEQ